uniref:Epithelial membrane protein 1 n=1 Tax=Astatotilapia calliptera TaxID=8154 RepID=A0AAX7TYR2_ASTCA
MLILLAAIFVLHIACIIILLTATIDNAWWVISAGNMPTDIWARWVFVNNSWHSIDLPSTYPESYLQAVQASSVLACIFSIIGIFVFVAQLFTLPKGQRFLVSGVFQFLACEYFFFLLCFIPFTEGVSLCMTSADVHLHSSPCFLHFRPVHHDRSLHLHRPLPY